VFAYKALLLLGPTGAGKSPLGDFIEENGFKGSRCGHFDFGAHLRQADSDPGDYPALTADDARIIRNVLHSGALLENHQFSIVEKLLTAFVAKKALGPTDWVLLNGMPRHIGQAEAVRIFADVKYVIYLRCDESMVHRRIAANVGGDRTGRDDDDLRLIRQKLSIFTDRTAPLVAHYKAAGVAVVEVPVGLETTPREIATHPALR
jgi:adenylate kinase